MIIESIMEYRCGHPQKVIASGHINRKRSLRKQLVEFTNRVPKREDGKIECRCPRCGRGAGWMILRINGVVVSGDSVDEMARSGNQILAGADLSVGPDQSMN